MTVPRIGLVKSPGSNPNNHNGAPVSLSIVIERHTRLHKTKSMHLEASTHNRKRGRATERSQVNRGKVVRADKLPIKGKTQSGAELVCVRSEVGGGKEGGRLQQ